MNSPLTRRDFLTTTAAAAAAASAAPGLGAADLAPSPKRALQKGIMTQESGATHGPHLRELTA